MRKVVLGISGPFSGPRVAFGDMLKSVCGDWNFAGSVETSFLDDESTPATACRVAQKFVERRVTAVIGHFNSECAKVAGAIQAALQLVQDLLSGEATNFNQWLRQSDRFSESEMRDSRFVIDWRPTAAL